MSDTAKAPEPTKAPSTPSKDSLLKHIEQVKLETLKLVGTSALNPYMYIKRNVTPVEEELRAAKEVSPALSTKVQALKAAALPTTK